MIIDKNRVLELLRSQGQAAQAAQADRLLPGKIDTSVPEHAGLLLMYGIEPATLEGRLGDLSGFGKTP